MNTPQAQPDTSTEREAFEAWAKRKCFDLTLLDGYPDDYKELESASAWEAWEERAAQAAPSQIPEGYELVPIEPKEKRAPVQGLVGGIPWAIHLEAYAVFCKKWGAQPALIDLEGRNCRGGFSTGVLDDFIPGWRDRVEEFGKLKAEVKELRARLLAAPQPPKDQDQP